MSSVPVYVAIEDRSHWSCIPIERALEWTRVFLRLIRTGLVPVRPFDGGLWAPWPALIEDGLSPDQATRLLLTRDAGDRR